MSFDSNGPHQGNPFASRHVRPGALPFVFPPGESLGGLVKRLRENGWRGEIVGPHGTGKTTLLEGLSAALAAAGRDVIRVSLHDNKHKLPVRLSRQAVKDETIVAVDGYEQLDRLERWRLGRLCRRRGWGLLITAHAPAGMPPLFRTEGRLNVLAALVDRLLTDRPGWIQASDLAAAFDSCQGDVREALFDLYDRYESRSRKNALSAARS